jgi:hypothetical protein
MTSYTNTQILVEVWGSFWLHLHLVFLPLLFLHLVGDRTCCLFFTVVSEGLLFWVALFIFLRLIPLTSCHVVRLVFSVMSSSIASSCGGDCGTQLVLMVWK